MTKDDAERLLGERRFQEMTWRIQRVGWVVMACVVLAALLGIFSGGPISWTTAQPPDKSFSVGYERLLRYTASSQLKISLPSGVSQSVIHINAQLAQALEIQRISPPPIRATATGDGISIEIGTMSYGPPPVVVIDVKPSKIGFLTGTVSLNGNNPVTLSNFVYP